ncbi:hypothetical protein [Sphingobacterium sp.]|uniref:hypothetical protein n=1 Tax=Sphingobacterium sp. TaxID=341027 RepID=UPI0028981C13|nr:hypothetical protein [Sphingobacterium sp.]
MKFEHNHKLNAKITHDILRETYNAVPTLMKQLAPEGWTASSFHQELMAARQEFYNEYLNNQKNYPISHDSHSPTEDKKSSFAPLTLEEYLSPAFPPLYNDYLELFYILSCVLVEITFASTLYRDHDPEGYYFDDIAFEDMVIQVAYENKQIDKDGADVMHAAFPAPYLDEMDLHSCLEVLFGILKKYGFKLDYYHDELLDIVELQRLHEELLFRDLDAEEKEKQRTEVRADILAVLYAYGCEATDPLDLHAIIDFFNRRLVCPLVLGYLHVYHEFPMGYPYRLEDYMF